MGNCCAVSSTTADKKGENKPVPTSGKRYILENPTGNRIEKTYVLGRVLGRGQFAKIYLCTDKSSGEVYACKSISKKKLRTGVHVEYVRREVEVMKHMPRHHNIATLKDTYEDRSAVHLVMELCEGGQLFDRIVARGYYTERAAVGVIKTIVEVIQTCHKHGVMLRNINTRNFLYANKKKTAALKAIGFELAVFFKPGERFNEIVAGNHYYMAPEVIGRNYGPEADVWSAGVVLYFLLSGNRPFQAENEEELVNAILRSVVREPWHIVPDCAKDLVKKMLNPGPKLSRIAQQDLELEQGIAQAIIRSVVEFKEDPWPSVSDSAKDLVKKMLNPDPKLRLTAQEVLDHPWIQSTQKIPNVSLGETVKTRLKQFSAMNNLKKRALRVIAEHLSAKEVAGMKQAFNLMDTNKRGKINIVELAAGLQKVGQQFPEADLQILMDAGDVDKDGYLNYGEFVAISVHLKKMGNDNHLKAAFAFFDKNKSGYIEFDELREALYDELYTNNENVIAAIIKQVDTDKDGKISFEEFTSMMKVGRKPSG